MVSKTIIMRVIFSALLVAPCLQMGLQIGFAQRPAKKPAAKPAVKPAVKPIGDAPLVKLTEQDIQLIIQSETKNSPQALKTLTDDPEQRKKVLKNLKEVLALASEARKTGFASESSIKIQLDLARQETLATAYDDKLKADAGKANDPGPPFGYITDKNVETFFAVPANKIKYAAEQEKFLAFIRDMQAKSAAPTEMNEEQKEFIISQWKKVIYGAVKAEALKLNNRKTELEWKLQQALILARSYTEEKLENVLTPTADEIKNYMAADPRFSKVGQRALAAQVLARSNAGEDFAGLANQYTEDPGNRDIQTGKPLGGFYDWRARGGYVSEFSDAAWALQEGQVSGVVETQFGYHIIKLEGKRTVKGVDGRDEEQIKVRHILISTAYKEPEIPGDSEQSPFTSMEEGAKKELGEKKKLKVMGEIALRNPIDLPLDFSLSKEPAPTSAPGATKGRKPIAKKKN